MVCPLQIRIRFAVELMTTTLMPGYVWVESFAPAVSLHFHRGFSASYDGASSVKLRHLRPSETVWDSLLQLKCFAVVIDCREHVAVPRQPGPDIPIPWRSGDENVEFQCQPMPALASKDGRLAAVLQDASERTLPAPAQVSINLTSGSNHTRVRLRCTNHRHVTIWNSQHDHYDLRPKQTVESAGAWAEWGAASLVMCPQTGSHQIPLSFSIFSGSDPTKWLSSISCLFFNRTEGDVCVCIRIIQMDMHIERERRPFSSRPDSSHKVHVWRLKTSDHGSTAVCSASQGMPRASLGTVCLPFNRTNYVDQ